MSEAKTPPPVRKRADGRRIETRTYRLITPLFGGGVEKRTPDPITTVRASEVRGQLRFWWRATCGGAYGGRLSAMRAAEEALWGSTTHPSEVSVAIELLQPGRPVPAFTVERKKGKPRLEPAPEVAAYAAFPLLPEGDEKHRVGWKSSPVWVGVEFRLHLRYPAEATDALHQTLWAWETFGGLGARTRRGFGALQCLDQPEALPTSRQAERWLHEHLSVLQGHRWPDGVPHLSLDASDYCLVAVPGSPIAVWKALIQALQKFRQKRVRFQRKDGTPSPYGMTRWPEPNAIRRCKGVAPKLLPGTTDDDWPDAFPRAAFGLPIVFHMPHDRGIHNDLVLRGRGGSEPIDRLASPLILRPLACRDGTVALAAILAWTPLAEGTDYTPPGGVFLEDGDRLSPVRSHLTPEEAHHVPVLHGDPNVLRAFLRYVRTDLTRQGRKP